MASLFDRPGASVVLKPQYRAYGAVKAKAVIALQDWLKAECGMQWNWAAIVAEHIVPRVIKEKQDAIAPSAPDVQLNFNDVLSIVVNASMMMAEKMDGNSELEPIIASHEHREEYQKHGI